MYRNINLNMNSFRLAKLIIVFTSLSFLVLAFLRNYNSPENIEKRCLFKFDKEFRNPLEKTDKEWEQILDFADNNYYKCMRVLIY